MGQHCGSRPFENGEEAGKFPQPRRRALSCMDSIGRKRRREEKAPGYAEETQMRRELRRCPFVTEAALNAMLDESMVSARLELRRSGSLCGTPKSSLLSMSAGEISVKSASIVLWEQPTQSPTSQELTECSFAPFTPTGKDSGVENGQDFRLSYRQKLFNQGAWLPPPQRLPQQRTLIIFDWDDTLMCTTAIQSQRVQARNRKLSAVSRAATALLELAKQLGSVLVVTNAAEGWVEASAREYLPQLVPLLEGIPVLSARSLHEDNYPYEVHMWKNQTFLQLGDYMDRKAVTNLIVIGDSQAEIDAGVNLGRTLEHAVIKTIQFKASPTPEMLEKELRLTAEQLTYITETGKNLSITFGPNKRSPRGSPLASAASPPVRMVPRAGGLGGA